MAYNANLLLILPLRTRDNLDREIKEQQALWALITALRLQDNRKFSMFAAVVGLSLMVGGKLSTKVLKFVNHMGISASKTAINNLISSAEIANKASLDWLREHKQLVGFFDNIQKFFQSKDKLKGLQTIHLTQQVALFVRLFPLSVL